jgi:hypothetical protein
LNLFGIDGKAGRYRIRFTAYKRRRAMPVDRDKIARLERELEEARAQMLLEDGERYRILWREISPEEKQRVLDNLKDRRERILFDLEAPDEPKRRGRPVGGGEKPAKSGGDLTCPICGKAGLTKRGLSLHRARLHKGEQANAAEEPE